MRYEATIFCPDSLCIFLSLFTTLSLYFFQISYYDSETSDDVSKARKWLQFYVENDEDASPENLAYTLEGMELTEAVSIINDMV